MWEHLMSLYNFLGYQQARELFQARELLSCLLLSQWHYCSHIMMEIASCQKLDSKKLQSASFRLVHKDKCYNEGLTHQNELSVLILGQDSSHEE